MKIASWILKAKFGGRWSLSKRKRALAVSRYNNWSSNARRNSNTRNSEQQEVG